MNTGRITVILALVAALGVGFASGVVITTYNVRQFVRHGFAPPPFGPGKENGRRDFKERIFKELSGRLSLTPDQEPVIRGILDAQLGKLRAAEQGFMQSMHATREEADREILNHLTAEQKVKFETWRQSVMPGRDAHQDGPPPPGGHDLPGDPPPDSGSRP